jgi:hypothetical protein
VPKSAQTDNKIIASVAPDVSADASRGV